MIFIVLNRLRNSAEGFGDKLREVSRTDGDAGSENDFGSDEDVDSESGVWSSEFSEESREGLSEEWEEGVGEEESDLEETGGAIGDDFFPPWATFITSFTKPTTRWISPASKLSAVSDDV